jgi:tRNA pseudouridine65 synthase
MTSLRSVTFPPFDDKTMMDRRRRITISLVVTCTSLYIGLHVASLLYSCCPGNAYPLAAFSVPPLSSRIPVLSYQPDWVCVNKPSGIAVHSSSRSSRQKTLRSVLKRQLSRKVHPIHRLDHRTSGALIFGFHANTTTGGYLHSRLRNATKTYVALVRGNWDVQRICNGQDSVTVEKSLLVAGVEKLATSVFHRLAVGEHNGQFCTLVSVTPQTGRLHQIRRHAYAMGMPILGDTQHGDSKVNRWWRENCGLHRLALHCLSIENFDGLDVVAPLPNDLVEPFRRIDESLLKRAMAIEPKLSHEWFDDMGGTLGVKKAWQQVS